MANTSKNLMTGRITQTFLLRSLGMKPYPCRESLPLVAWKIVYLLRMANMAGGQCNWQPYLCRGGKDMVEA